MEAYEDVYSCSVSHGIYPAMQLDSRRFSRLVACDTLLGMNTLSRCLPRRPCCSRPRPPIFAADPKGPAVDTSFLKQYAETRGFMLGRPQKPKSTPDGKAVLFLRADRPSAEA